MDQEAQEAQLIVHLSEAFNKDEVWQLAAAEALSKATNLERVLIRGSTAAKQLKLVDVLIRKTSAAGLGAGSAAGAGVIGPHGEMGAEYGLRTPRQAGSRGAPPEKEGVAVAVAAGKVGRRSAQADGRGIEAAAVAVITAANENAYGNFFEFPAINPRFRGKPYRYMYGTAAIRPTNMGNALARHDLEKGSSIVCSIPGSMPGQPIFVPRPDGSTEDDGVLLAPKIMPGGRSVLCVYDAADMSGLANVDLPFKVPYRFHGAYVAAKD
ncbi:hypothetical protein VOLCADRAFT_97226 [Volvox carteri f. nagariensis]|uniref:Carotenoid cleavage dioxygenase n=1 Tax=Volvox carteri f. nagariensis TaxID=3068 RepID=D8UC71_VOLCA|nr:uncharacterized protein VOLCADRAFT_97226 [Volvox carteri f. nagariensis]EFJ42644.1 hypothetical protein VOLCADRAFT_97226 [Volvox carteri f. nagariensis]|eukprot:XP_002956295.1 hypothetical protein VOLCADRAFT_97226 [Volvox carteri f. nagariensis]